MSPSGRDIEEAPWEWLRVAVEISDMPARVFEPNDAIRHGRARLFRDSEQEERGPNLATLDWMQVEYGYGIDHGVDAFEIADAESQDLCALHEVFFDEGDLRAPFGQLEGMGHDLLVLDAIEVKAADHFAIYAGELLEHVLRRWSQSCFAAAYIEDRPMSPNLAEVLLTRGFQWHRQAGFGLYVADLGAPRPELPGEPKRAAVRVSRESSGH